MKSLADKMTALMQQESTKKKVEDKCTYTDGVLDMYNVSMKHIKESKDDKTIGVSDTQADKEGNTGSKDSVSTK